MTGALLFISVCEFYLAFRKIYEVLGFLGDPAEFISKSSFEDWFYVRDHMIVGFLTAQAATIWTLL